MFTHNINPIIFSIGPLEIRWYSLAYILGFLFAIWFLMYLSKNKKIELTKDQIYDFVFWLIIGVIVGGRLGYVFFWNPSYYISKPLEIFMIWHGGMAFHGGLLGAIIAGYLFCKKNKISFWRMADIISIPAIFALALGRIANFINAELYGPVTNVSWCVNFPDAEGCRHPYQIYAFLKRIFVGLILLFVWISNEKYFDKSGKRKYKDGFIFWLMIMLLGIGRFIIDFWRVDDSAIIGLSIGQWMSLIMFIVGLGVLIALYFRTADLNKK